MKWGGRKTSSSSSSSNKPSFISQVSPFTWLSKFKQMRINSEPKHGKLRQNAKQNSLPSESSPPQDACGNRGRFYGGDDDAFWRLSFGEESHEQKKGEDVTKPAVHNLDDEHVIQSSTCPSGRLNDKRHGRSEGTLRFKQKDIGLGEDRKLPNETKTSLGMDECNHGKEFELLRKRYERKAQGVLQEQLLKLERATDEAEFASSKCKSLEKDELQFESPRTICTPRTNLFISSVDSKNSRLRSIREAGVNSEKTDRVAEKKLGSEWQNWKQTQELKVKVNKKRQSLHMSREQQRRKPKHSPKVRVHSPRLASKAEICKIKAIEDMKKAKLKMKKEEEIVEEAAGLDSFAVVKCSLDPHQDFKDSMIEMITEKKISQPEQMEELLACYLTLNSNEYHDLIIKVFREVWLYVSQASLGLKSDKQCSCHD